MECNVVFRGICRCCKQLLVTVRVSGARVGWGQNGSAEAYSDELSRAFLSLKGLSSASSDNVAIRAMSVFNADSNVGFGLLLTI